MVTTERLLREPADPTDRRLDLVGMDHLLEPERPVRRLEAIDPRLERIETGVLC